MSDYTPDTLPWSWLLLIRFSWIRINYFGNDRPLNNRYVPKLLWTFEVVWLFGTPHPQAGGPDIAGQEPKSQSLVWNISTYVNIMFRAKFQTIKYIFKTYYLLKFSENLGFTCSPASFSESLVASVCEKETFQVECWKTFQLWEPNKQQATILLLATISEQCSGNSCRLQGGFREWE